TVQILDEIGGRHPDDDDYLPTDATVADVRDARDEIVRLRALITEWADATDAGERDPNFLPATYNRWDAAVKALRKEANR
ncbi:MAG: hypothetical protein ACOVP8_07395, partial [Phycisphaerales bacterium]